MSHCSYFTYSIYDSGVAKVLKLFIFLGCLPLNQIFSRQSQWWFVNIILVSSWSPHGVSLKSMHSLTQPSFLICYQFKTTRKVNCSCLSYVQRKKKKNPCFWMLVWFTESQFAYPFASRLLTQIEAWEIGLEIVKL